MCDRFNSIHFYSEIENDFSLEPVSFDSICVFYLLTSVKYFHRITRSGSVLHFVSLAMKCFDEPKKNQRKGQNRRMEGEYTGHHSKIVAFIKREKT